MGTKLYGNSEVALRELLQNSIDACLLRQAQEKMWGNPYVPEISVKYYQEGEEILLEVADNGTGMDQDIIDNYYSKVGSSFYKSVDFYNLKAESNAEFTPTSRFGIGILSCFMVADTLIVDTKRVYSRHRSSEPLNIIVEGQESIFWIKEGERQSPGTATKLVLRKAQNPWDKMTEEEFIRSVETVIPNPPFRICIETESRKKTRDENSFKEVTAAALKDSSWRDHEHLKVFEVSFDSLGVIGTAVLAVLERRGRPVPEIEIASHEINIQGEDYTLKKKLWLSENSVREESNSITVNDEGEISQHSTDSELAASRSRISLHGIEVSTTLFPKSWQMKKHQVKISWPVPIILVVDIGKSRDLDLNSSRTEIIMSEKWLRFEEDLAFIICSEVAANVGHDYWRALKTVLIKKNKSEQFLRGISRVE